MTLTKSFNSKLSLCLTSKHTSKVITAIFNNNPGPDVWDPLFREAVARLLASVLAMAIAGRPDTAQAFLDSGAAFESIGERRGD